MKITNSSVDTDEKRGLYIRLIGWGISGVLYLLTILAIYIIYMNSGWTNSMYIPLGILLFSLIANIVMNIVILLIKNGGGR